MSRGAHDHNHREIFALTAVCHCTTLTGTLADPTTGLLKNEAIRDGSPFQQRSRKTIDDVEWVTAQCWHAHTSGTKPGTVQESEI
jgi:hypothetical protein